MFMYENHKWVVYPYKVRYTNEKSENERNVTEHALPSKEWWLNVANRHSHIIIHEFIELEPLSKEQIERLEEINSLNIPDGYGELVENYVINNEFPEGLNHPLKGLQLQKENEKLLIQSAENTAETIETMITLHEIQKIEQAESNAELIELMMMLQGGM